jgi:hypothetical protein
MGIRKCEMEYKGHLLYAKSGGSSAKPAVLDGKRGHNNEVWDFTFTTDGNFFCAVGHKGILGADCDQTKLWDVQTGMCLYNYKGDTEDVFAVVASGKRFYTAQQRVLQRNPGQKHQGQSHGQADLQPAILHTEEKRGYTQIPRDSRCFHQVCAPAVKNSDICNRQHWS